MVVKGGGRCAATTERGIAARSAFYGERGIAARGDEARHLPLAAPSTERGIAARGADAEIGAIHDPRDPEPP
jgi:hypothetical protein